MTIFPLIKKFFKLFCEKIDQIVSLLQAVIKHNYA